MLNQGQRAVIILRQLVASKGDRAWWDRVLLGAEARVVLSMPAHVVKEAVELLYPAQKGRAKMAAGWHGSRYVWPLDQLHEVARRLGERTYYENGVAVHYFIGQDIEDEARRVCRDQLHTQGLRMALLREKLIVVHDSSDRRRYKYRRAA